MNKTGWERNIISYVVAFAWALLLAVGFIVPAEVKAETKEGYVLMNIPYEKFYEAELAAGSTGVDAVSSATRNKPRTGTLAGGSYHVNSDGSDISGVIYPVYVKDMSVLSSYTEITDSSSVDITVTNRGNTTTSTYSGKDALFESADYSYYVLSEEPAIYKTLQDDGSFSVVNKTASSVSGVTGDVTVGARHADVEIKLTGTEGIAQGDSISGIILTDSDGKTYGLRHIVNVWRAVEIGWNFEDMDLGGKNITNIRYYTQKAVIDYPVNIAIPRSAYVMMNIPYSKFYVAELDAASAEVDACTSATTKKSQDSGAVGGSYHVTAGESVNIKGVIYPVFVKDITSLAAYTEIAATSQDDLFASDDYTYYKLAEAPAIYKTLSEDGSFSAVNARASSVEGVTGDVTVGGRHAEIEIKLSGTEGIAKGDKVSGVVLTDSDGAKYGLRHLANIYKAVELGADSSMLLGKTISNIRYITQDAVIDYPVSIPVTAPRAITTDQTELTLENIGDKAQLKLLVTDPENASAAGTTICSSQDEGIATISKKGEVTAVAAGTTTVTITCKFGETELHADCTVTVLDKAAVDAVKEKLEALSDESSEEDVAAARTALDTLNERQQQEIADLITKLESQEKRIADAKQAEEDKKTEDQEKTTEAASALKKGDLFRVGALKYKVSGAKTASCTGAVKKTISKASVPASVTYRKQTFKVTAIEKNAFKGYKKLTKVTVGNNVTSINTAAFASCKKLNTVVIGKKVKVIGAKAFSGDKKLKKITVKTSLLKRVGGKAFSGIYKKAVIKVPAKKLKKYKKLMKNKGQKKTVKIR